jgi:hypothetical protein
MKTEIGGGGHPRKVKQVKTESSVSSLFKAIVKLPNGWELSCGDVLFD